MLRDQVSRAVCSHDANALIITILRYPVDESTGLDPVLCPHLTLTQNLHLLKEEQTPSIITSIVSRVYFYDLVS